MSTSRIIIFDDVSLSKERLEVSEIKKCEEYAEGIVRRSFCASLCEFKQVDTKKFEIDHCIGKLAEVAAKKFLARIAAIETSLIDYTIRSLDEVREIGHDADLIAPGIKVHVKACRALSPFPESYCFSVYDEAMSNPTAEDYLCAVLIDYRGEEYTTAKVRAFVPLSVIKREDLFKMPLKGTQQKLTRFVYSDDLKALGSIVQLQQ